MDRVGRAIVRTDGWFWHVSNALAGVVVLVGTALYVPPGAHSVDLIVGSVDPFYVLGPLAVLYTVWCGVGLWRWSTGTDVP